MNPRPEILVVDDKPECLFACEKILADIDATVVRTTSGNEALKATFHHDFALAIIDVKMPEMDGYELARFLRDDERTKDIPIIFLSAVYTDELHISKGYESGAVDFLTKPCNPKLLASKVKIFLSLDQQKKRLQALIGELEKTNRQLSNEIAERKSIESALRESETRYRAIVQDQTELICRFKPEGPVVFVNEACCRYIDRKPDEIVGESFWPFIPEEDHGLLRKAFSSLSPEKPVVTIEHRILAADGQFRWEQWTNRALFDEDGRIFEIQAVGRDITDRRQAEEALKAANKEIEAFSYSVSHDLRAPLRRIEGFSKALLEDCSGQLDETAKDYLNRVCAAAQKMDELINAMLSLSRLTRGELGLKRVNLTDMAKKIADELKKSEPERHVEFAIAEGLVAQGDSAMLQAVLDNLMRNAWKFTAKQPRAKIEVGRQSSEGKNVYFVRDNGAGFDMTYAHKLFVAFQRLHRESDFPGIGIGLTTVQRIIHRHGGRIWAEGDLGRGATFYFTLG